MKTGRVRERRDRLKKKNSLLEGTEQGLLGDTERTGGGENEWKT